jgi:hypothetical protein
VAGKSVSIREPARGSSIVGANTIMLIGYSFDAAFVQEKD